MDQMGVGKFVAVLDEVLKRFEQLGRHDRSGYKKSLEEQYFLSKRVYEFIFESHLIYQRNSMNGSVEEQAKAKCSTE